MALRRGPVAKTRAAAAAHAPDFAFGLKVAASRQCAWGCLAFIPPSGYHLHRVSTHSDQLTHPTPAPAFPPSRLFSGHQRGRRHHRVQLCAGGPGQGAGRARLQPRQAAGQGPRLPGGHCYGVLWAPCAAVGCCGMRDSSAYPGARGAAVVAGARMPRVLLLQACSRLG